jgi:hypothetical protein
MIHQHLRNESPYGFLRRFPYHVVYLEMPGAIRILAFAHDRRSPGYWHTRATP